MMGRSSFLRFLVFSCLLALCFSHGFGRNLVDTADQHADSSVPIPKETHGLAREMIEVMDYEDPQPNVNPRTGYLFSPPPRRN